MSLGSPFVWTNPKSFADYPTGAPSSRRPVPVQLAECYPIVGVYGISARVSIVEDWMPPRCPNPQNENKMMQHFFLLGLTDGLTDPLFFFVFCIGVGILFFVGTTTTTRVALIPHLSLYDRFGRQWAIIKAVPVPVVVHTQQVWWMVTLKWCYFVRGFFGKKYPVVYAFVVECVRGKNDM